MKARLSIESSKKLKKEEKTEVKALQPFYYDFKNPSSLTPFDKLSQPVIKQMISPLLDYADQRQLIQVSQNFYYFFQKTCLTHLKLFLSHVVHGDLTKVEDMIKKDPAVLLDAGTVAMTYTNQIYKGTALQIAWNVQDEEMVILLQSYMDLSEIKKQFKTLFPDKYKSYQKEKEVKIQHGFKIIETTFRAISESKIEFDNEGTFVIGEPAQSAITRLREYLNSKNIRTSENLTIILLCKALRSYAAIYTKLNVSKSEKSKDVLIWRILGFFQRCMPWNYLQAYSAGLSDTFTNKAKGYLQKRSLIFEIWDDKMWNKISLDSMFSSLDSGLGFDYAIQAEGRGVTSMSRGIDNILMTANSLEKLYQLKNKKLIELVEHPIYKQSPKRCSIM